MIKFDSRSKKPKLYNVVLLTAVFILLLGIFKFSGFNDPLLPVITIEIYLLLVIIMLIDAFIKQIEYSPYSYNTIYYIGFSLFLVSVLAVIFIIIIHYKNNPLEASLLNIAGSLLYSSRLFMYLSFPFILVFSISLCISNISLIRHEGLGFTNILGIIFSILLIGVDLFVYLYDYYASGSIREIIIHEIIVTVFSTIYLYIECMLIGTIIANLIVNNYKPAFDKDFAIILGCGIFKDGSLTPLLKGRVDKAIEFYNRQKEMTGKELTFICSGGQGPDEIISEAKAMKNYLLSKGFKDEQIIEEDRSTNTLENMRFSKEIIDNINEEAKMIFVTNGFHVFRSGIKARRVKMKAYGIGSKTKWYFWPNASVREFIGLLATHKGKQFCVLLTIFMIYIALIYFVYISI